MSNTIFSLIPPIVAILMVILTRRVLLSLGVGIVAAAFLLAEFKIGETLQIIFEAIKGILYSHKSPVYFTIHLGLEIS